MSICRMHALASTSPCASSMVVSRKLPSYLQLCSHSVTLWIQPQSLTRYKQNFACPINFALTRENPNSSSGLREGPKNLENEPHKYFDQVVITVRSGDGGNGAVLKLPKPKLVDSEKDKFKKKDKKPAGTYKRGNDGALILPLGGQGGDVFIVADESLDTLLPYHQRRRHNAKRGANVDTVGVLSPSLRDGLNASVLRIPVPVGTVVKRKRGGKFIADLAKHGDEIMVARGGRGGICVVESKDSDRLKRNGVITIQDSDEKVATLGGPGEEIALELTLRVVADVGLVGFPNAGKSSLLAAVTAAKPEIAAYPFTTLVPNLGCLEGDPLKNDGGYSRGATMADLPGLIKDAHLGKGLGRMFLRHLRRTRVLVHVVDASTPNPVEDYIVLREELHLYNPEYTKRPHVVVLNKLDLPEARERFESLRETIENLGVEETVGDDAESSRLPRLDSAERLDSSSMQEQSSNTVVEERKIQIQSRPAAVVGISAREGEGMEKLLEVIRDTLQKEQKQARKLKTEQLRSKSLKHGKAPQWQL